MVCVSGWHMPGIVSHRLGVSAQYDRSLDISRDPSRESPIALQTVDQEMIVADSDVVCVTQDTHVFEESELDQIQACREGALSASGHISLKVAFDISVLGFGHHRSLARTGIFRVAENLALGLHSVECELVFCATHSCRTFLETADYLRGNPDLANVSLLPSRHRGVLLRPLCRGADRANAIQTRNVLVRVVRWAVREGAAATLDKLCIPSVRELRGVNVFHSPFHPLPPNIGRPGIARFLTVCDVIPKLHPELFTEDAKVAFDRILASLQPTDWVLCISESTKRDFCLVTGFDPGRVFVTYPAASSAIFYPCTSEEDLRRVRTKYGIPDGPYVLSVNTLEPRKNIHHLIRSFADMVGQGKIGDLSLVLVGARGWRYGAIDEALADAPWLEKRIVQTGFVDDADLAAIYSGARMFVYVPIYEGFGLPPLEAMQCGVPVIASSTSSLPEVVGGAGIMVNPHDREELCRSMLKLYQDSSLAKHMSSASLDMAKNFTWDRCVQQTLHAYRFAVDQG
jgi:glycosyltransferase involved in cell wall biosynthesis